MAHMTRKHQAKNAFTRQPSGEHGDLWGIPVAHGAVRLFKLLPIRRNGGHLDPIVTHCPTNSYAPDLHQFAQGLAPISQLALRSDCAWDGTIRASGAAPSISRMILVLIASAN